MSDASTPAASRLVFQPGLLAGRTALITGGNGGIGLGIAEVYGLLGASLVIVGRDLDKLAQAQVQLAETGARVITVVGDVREHDCAEQAVAQAVAVFGGLDILVNNAAGNFHSPFESMSPKGWRAVIEIDLNGTFNFCHAAFAPLRDSAHGGCIINISLSQAVSGWPGAAHAASAKAGVTTLTRSLAVEWGGHGIRVNNVLPGPIENTEGVRRLYEARGQADKELSRMALGRFGQVDDIAQACAYLASPAANFITGCDLTVDGGRALKRAWV